MRYAWFGLLAVAAVSASSFAQEPGKGLNMLTAAQIAALPANQRLELLRFKMQPDLLKDKTEFQEFVAINNCNQSFDALTRLYSEFDLPQLRDAYGKAQAQILGNLGTVWTNDANSMVYTLGDYNFARKSFPFVQVVNGAPTPVTVQFETLQLTVAGQQPPGQMYCKTADGAKQMKLSFPAAGFTYRDYYVQIPKVTINEFPIDEAAARKYVYSVLNLPREVYFRVDVEIQPTAPTVNGNKVTYTGAVKRITVMKNNDGAPVGVLYEKK